MVKAAGNFLFGINNIVFAVIQYVYRFIAVIARAAFNNNIACAHFLNARRSFFNFVKRFHLIHTGNIRRFQSIRRNNVGTAYQHFFNGFGCFRHHNCVNALAHHYRVNNNVLQTVFINGIGNQLHQFSAAEHACFHGVNADAFHNGFYLFFNNIHTDWVHSVVPVKRVLRHNNRQRRHAVHAHGGKCF